MGRPLNASVGMTLDAFVGRALGQGLCVSVFPVGSVRVQLLGTEHFGFSGDWLLDTVQGQIGRAHV